MKIFAYAVLLIQLLIVTGFWGWNHVRHPLGNQLTGDAVGQLLAYGRLAGLLAAFATLLQLILIGRVRWVEQAFGLDRLTRLHRFTGLAVVLLLLAHPILVTLGHAAQAGVSYHEQSLDFMRTWEDVAAATAGLILMLVAIGMSVVLIRKRLRYETWYAVHLSLYLALALGFGHQLSVGNDLAGNVWFRGYWIALYVFVAANLLGYRFLRPLLAMARHRFVVARCQAETPDVTSVYIGGLQMEKFRARGGQFVIVRFLVKGFRWEAHPFSISARPDGRQIRLTIKQLGDFTRRIPELKPGTRVLIDGPHGIFTADRCRSKKVLLLAGGIGITPIRAMIEDLAAQGCEMLLLYANRNRASVVFEKELAALASTVPQFRVVHVLSADPEAPGEKGMIDRERLIRLAPDIVEREVYLCGPPVMMKIARKNLRTLGVPKNRIHDERFSL